MKITTSSYYWRVFIFVLLIVNVFIMGSWLVTDFPLSLMRGDTIETIMVIETINIVITLFLITPGILTDTISKWLNLGTVLTILVFILLVGIFYHVSYTSLFAIAKGGHSAWFALIAYLVSIFVIITSAIIVFFGKNLDRKTDK